MVGYSCEAESAAAAKAGAPSAPMVTVTAGGANTAAGAMTCSVASGADPAPTLVPANRRRVSR